MADNSKIVNNSLLKSSISIKSIQNSVSNFAEGIVNAKQTASKIVEQTAADWEMKAILPGEVTVWEKLALRPMCGISNPKQLGPSSDTLAALAAVFSDSFCSILIPAAMTTAFLQPNSPSSTIMSVTVCLLVQITARSGTMGNLVIEG